MSQNRDCPTQLGSDDAVRYAAGTLEDASVDGFEVHLLGCARCQAVVTEAAELSGALQAGVPARRTVARRRWLVPAVAAAAIVTLLVLPDRADVTDLGRLDAGPEFSGAAVRAEGGEGAVVDRGMEAYVNGSWASAAELLGSAPGAEVTTGTLFFLGAALLMSGDASGAADALDTASSQEGPYQDEAHFYAAKARLTLGQTDAALERLDAVTASHPQVGSWSRALADSVRERRR